MRYFLIVVAILLGWLGLAAGLVECSKHVSPHAGEASWTLQGETSHLDCPGAHPWFVEVEGTRFFMGCYL